MRPLLYVASALIVMALAFWAYRENYATQKALKEMAALQDEIAGLRESIATQRAEWAFLNRPDRLRELATLNFDRLGLLPMEPEQFGDGKSVAFPVASAPLDIAGAITGSIDTQGEAAPQQESTP